MKKRIFTLVAATAVCLLTARPAYAYVDPSATTYLLQAGIGVAVAVGAAVVVVWRRAKKKVAQKLHIDENAGKEVEGEVTRKTTPQ